MDELIHELIALVQQTAPELWRIATRQVVARTVQCSVGLFIGLLILWLCYVGYKKLRDYKNSDKYNQFDDDMGVAMGFFIIGLVALFGAIYIACAINNLIGLLINPEYYAIEELLDLVKP